MNTFQNPTDNFRSYSFEYILTVSPNTEILSELLGTSGQVVPQVVSALQAKSPGEEIKTNKGSAYLVMDTRRFSQYSITNLKMEHIYGTGPISNPTVPVNTTHMTVIDTTGSFFLMLMTLFKEKMKSSRASSFFLLSIVWVGHKDDGTTEVISTCNIPLLLILMSFTTDERGSEFEIEFMEVEGAPPPGGGNESMNYIGSAMTINTDEQGSSNLVSLINAFEKRLNVQALDYYLRASNDAETQNNGGVEKLSDGKSYGKLVQYMITIPKEWENFKCDLATPSKSAERSFIAKTLDAPASSSGTAPPPTPISLSTVEPKGSTVQKSFANNTLITNAIQDILNCCSAVIELSSEVNRKAGTAIIFRIIPTVTSDDTSYILHFDVMPYKLPNITAKTLSTTNTPTNQTISPGTNNVPVGASSTIKNLITYDYIFTGKNSQIMDLKIKYLPESAIGLDTNLNLGDNLLQSISSAGQKTSNVQAASSQAKKSKTYSPLIRSGDPLFIPFKTADQQQNNTGQSTDNMSEDDARKNFRAKQEQTQTFAYLHFISSINLDIVVRGNPNLIRKYADRKVRGGIAPHTLTISVPDLRKVNVSSSSFSAASWYNKTLAQKNAAGKQQYYAKYIQPRLDSYTKTGQGLDPVMDGADVSVQPLFCKINIKTPFVDWAGNYVDQQMLFSNRFFYNGPYLVLLMTTNFSATDFSHSLNLIPYAISDNLSSIEDNVDKSKSPVPANTSSPSSTPQPGKTVIPTPVFPTRIIPGNPTGGGF